MEWPAVLDGAPARADDRVHAGQTVSLRLAAEPPLYHPAPWAIALNIPYADASLLVVDKPAPMACQSSARQPDNTLENALCAWEGNPPDYVYRPVNRLDKGTSGLMVVARSAHVQQLLSAHTPPAAHRAPAFRNIWPSRRGNLPRQKA